MQEVQEGYRSNPAPSYRRVSRYDETGLIWLLRGRAIVALTATEAAIQGADRCPRLPQAAQAGAWAVGDSLDDFGAAT